MATGQLMAPQRHVHILGTIACGSIDSSHHATSVEFITMLLELQAFEEAEVRSSGNTGISGPAENFV